MNNENLTIHTKVKDFNAWHASYNGHEQDRASAGTPNSRVFRSADNQNDVVILAYAADQNLFVPEVSDEALESAAGADQEITGNYTFGGCTGLSVCPGVAN